MNLKYNFGLITLVIMGILLVPLSTVVAGGTEVN